MESLDGNLAACQLLRWSKLRSGADSGGLTDPCWTSINNSIRRIDAAFMARQFALDRSVDERAVA